MRTLFFRVLVPLLPGLIHVSCPGFIGLLWLAVIIGILLIIGITNSLQPQHSILRNFPVLAYFRYLFEFISPASCKLCIIERNADGKPFSRQQRALAYQRCQKY